MGLREPYKILTVYNSLWSYRPYSQGSTDNFDSHQRVPGSNDIFMKGDIIWTSKNLVFPLGVGEVGNVR